MPEFHSPRMFDMQKTFSGLSLAILLIAGQALADEKTMNAVLAALNGTETSLTAGQSRELAAAEGEALADAIANLVIVYPDQASAIVNAAIQANAGDPNLIAMISQKAIAAATAQNEALATAVRTATYQAGSNFANGGGGSEPTASPN